MLGTACVAELVLLRREPERFTPRQRRHGPVWAALGLAFVALMLAGVGLTAALLTLCLLAVLAPCAFWFLKGRG